MPSLCIMFEKNVFPSVPQDSKESQGVKCRNLYYINMSTPTVLHRSNTEKKSLFLISKRELNHRGTVDVVNTNPTYLLKQINVSSKR